MRIYSRHDGNNSVIDFAMQVNKVSAS